MLMYAILDRKMREFGPIVLAPNQGTVERSLIDGVNVSNSVMERRAQDFDLYEVGAFDQLTGVVHAAEIPILLRNVAEVLQGAVQGGAPGDQLPLLEV